MQLALIDGKTKTLRVLKLNEMWLQGERRGYVEKAVYDISGGVTAADAEQARRFDYDKPEEPVARIEDFTMSAILQSQVIQ